MVPAVLRSLCAISTATITIACAPSSWPNTSHGPFELAAQLSAGRDIIERVEIQKSTGVNAYETIHQLRPDFLRNRAADNDASARLARHPNATMVTDSHEGYPTIFVNGIRQGGPATLRSIPTGSIIRVRYYREPKIPVVYGPNNPGGIIEVTTKL